jgi:hypothetical protein
LPRATKRGAFSSWSTNEDGGRAEDHRDDDREREQNYERIHGNTGTRQRPGAASLRPGLPRNAIADGANSAATLASAQSDHLGIADKEGATVSNRARADSLAYE